VSGTLLHTWPVHTQTAYVQAGRLSAYGRTALYFVDSRYAAERLHLVDLDTGRELVLPPTQHLGRRDAVVRSLGVVYAVNKYTFGAHPTRAGTLVAPAHGEGARAARGGVKARVGHRQRRDIRRVENDRPAPFLW
jgi:hypothetical protein